MKKTNQTNPTDALFRSYRTRLVREGMVSSLFSGLTVGAGAVFLAALACWLFRFRGVWLPLSIGGAAFVVSAVCFYLLKFRPTGTDVVRRVDSMGLEERALTMRQLAGEDSYIARLQREDTVEKVSAVTREQVRSSFPLFAVKTWAIILLGAMLLSGVGMTTVMALSASGVLPQPDIFVPDEKRDQFFSVSYLVDGGGDIDGEAEQPVLAGEDAMTVVAVAEDGWVFVKWSDGVKEPSRTDRHITSDMSVTAVFEELVDGEGGDGDDGGQDKNEGDEDKDAPTGNAGGSSDTGGDSGNGEQGTGEGDKGNGSGSGEGGQPGDGSGTGRGDGAGGGWSDASQIIDGKTNYRDVKDLYYDQAMEIIRNGGDLPEYLREFIEKYYGSI